MGRDKRDPLIDREIGEGRYRIVEFIGEGGMGRVYRGEQLVVNRPVAIKVLHEHWAREEKLLARFRIEAQGASRLNHQHIVTLYDSGESEDGLLYIVMELLQGESLLSLLEREGPLQPARALFMMEQVAAALTAIHRKELIHRDLKPENIQIDQRADFPDFVKVLDFSIVKFLDAVTPITIAGAVFGTPQYMSPEQVRGRSIDVRTDIYAFGIILYQLLVGRPPFGGENPREIMMAQLTEPLPPLPQLTQDRAAQEALEELLKACLQKNLEERIDSALTLLERLRALTQSHFPPSLPPHIGQKTTESEALEFLNEEPQSAQGAKLPVAFEAPPALLPKPLIDPRGETAVTPLPQAGGLPPSMLAQSRGKLPLSLIETPITRGDPLLNAAPHEEALPRQAGTEITRSGLVLPSVLDAASSAEKLTSTQSDPGYLLQSHELEVLSEEPISAPRALPAALQTPNVLPPVAEVSWVRPPHTEPLSIPPRSANPPRGLFFLSLLLLCFLGGLLYFQEPSAPPPEAQPRSELSVEEEAQAPPQEPEPLIELPVEPAQLTPSDAPSSAGAAPQRAAAAASTAPRGRARRRARPAPRAASHASREQPPQRPAAAAPPSAPLAPPVPPPPPPAPPPPSPPPAPPESSARSNAPDAFMPRRLVPERERDWSVQKLY